MIFLEFYQSRVVQKMCTFGGLVVMRYVSIVLLVKSKHVWVK